MSLESHFHWLVGDVPLVQEGTELVHLRSGLSQGADGKSPASSCEEEETCLSDPALHPKGSQPVNFPYLEGLALNTDSSVWLLTSFP